MIKNQVRTHGSETQEQITVIAYCDWKNIPIVHITNEGKRSVVMGAQLKRAGLRPGFPDLFVPLPVGKYHGLFVELKVGKNKPNENQKKWIQQLNENGYYAVVCWGSDEAIKTIDAYRKGEAVHD